MTNIIKKYIYKKELKSILLKLSYLLEEAHQDKATEADVEFWLVCLERLEHINNSGLIANTQTQRDFYLSMYNKYIKKFAK